MRARLSPAVLLCAALAAPASAQAPAPMLGYSSAQASVERAWEEKLRTLPDPANLRENMRLLSARPHPLGSARDKANAEWILARFREWGWDAHLETFEVLFPTPAERLLEMVAPRRFAARLAEPPVAGDTTAPAPEEALPSYNAYSPDGDVTGPLVYVNYGGPQDYEELARRGVSVRGAIVLARYGHNWRGLKPQLAAEHGAIGCLIYSDPRDDGFSQGETYPDGPWRPRDGVQRGSVLKTLYEGDPLTPGVAATPDARRLAIADAPVLPRVPVLPISYADAEPLLSSMGGPVAPEPWRGGLALTYRLGPGPAKVHLKLAFHWDRKTLYDVVARMAGTTDADQWVIRGNHHDAWVDGAADPISGLSALLEEARALGALARQGWKPRRTILYCAWDGEEEGLFGSTEWAEAHQDELAAHAVAYVNSDSNGRGYLRASGSHVLEGLVNDVARDVPDPETKLSVGARERLRRVRHAASKEDRQEAWSRPNLRLGALGSGSDYTTFLDHLGIASLNLGFGGEGGGGVYHSAYDDFAWYTRFSDTDFAYGRALARTAGSAVLRLADSEFLPFDFAGLADTVGRYVQEVEKLGRTRREEVEEKNREIAQGVFTATADPRETFVPPVSEAEPAQIDWTGLDQAMESLTHAAARWQKAADGLAQAGKFPGAAALPELNRLLLQSERRWTDDAGLPGRPFFRHVLYAPGAHTGYAVKTLPGPREALEEGRWSEARTETARAARAVEREAGLIDEIARRLEAASGGAEGGR